MGSTRFFLSPSSLSAPEFSNDIYRCPSYRSIYLSPMISVSIFVSLLSPPLTDLYHLFFVPITRSGVVVGFVLRLENGIVPLGKGFLPQPAHFFRSLSEGDAPVFADSKPLLGAEECLEVEEGALDLKGRGGPIRKGSCKFCGSLGIFYPEDVISFCNSPDMIDACDQRRAKERGQENNTGKNLRVSNLSFPLTLRELFNLSTLEK